MVRKSSFRKFEYCLYSASNGTERFWHWEILRPGSSKPIKGGVVYGTKQAAKDKIAVEMLQLSKRSLSPPKTKETHVKNKIITEKFQYFLY